MIAVVAGVDVAEADAVAEAPQDVATHLAPSETSRESGESPGNWTDG